MTEERARSIMRRFEKWNEKRIWIVFWVLLGVDLSVFFALFPLSLTVQRGWWLVSFMVALWWPLLVRFYFMYYRVIDYSSGDKICGRLLQRVSPFNGEVESSFLFTDGLPNSGDIHRSVVNNEIAVRKSANVRINGIGCLVTVTAIYEFKDFEAWLRSKSKIGEVSKAVISERHKVIDVYSRRWEWALRGLSGKQMESLKWLVADAQRRNQDANLISDIKCKGYRLDVDGDGTWWGSSFLGQ